MRLRDDFVAVEVPVTSVNLGPGFNSMGLALDLWDGVSVHAATGATLIVVEGEGVGNAEQGEDNLVVCALHLALDRVDAPQVGMHMHCTNHIPHSRGLSSSASAIVIGVTLARALTGDADVLDRREILTIGSQMEGHPDNVALAVFDDATVPWTDDETFEVGSVRLTPPEGISPVAFIPDFELCIAAARVALPATVPRGDTSFSVARGALLVAVFSGNTQTGGGADLYALLMEATRDHLHQEQRWAATEFPLALVDWLRGAGFAAVVSDADPTVLSLESVGADIRRDTAAAGWRVVPMGVAPQGAQITRGSLSKMES